MHRRTLLLPLITSGCLLGVDPFKGGANVPELDGPVVLVLPDVPAEDEVFYAKAGDEVVVDVPTAADIDPEGSTVELGGVAMTFVDEVAEHVWRYRAVVGEDENDGPRVVSGVLRDLRGGETRFTSESLVTVDVTPPVASCILSPTPARGGVPVSLVVTLSEPLTGAVPYVTTSAPTLGVGDPEEDSGRQFTFPLEPAENTNYDGYVLQITGTDLAGNAQVGDSMCAAEDRTGSIFGRGPRLADGQDVEVEISEFVVHNGRPWIRAGATVRVTVPTAEPIDLTASSLALSGFVFAHEDGNTWRGTYTGSEGDGLKDVDARLLDPAGNELVLRREDVLRTDFTPPSADCFLTPPIAKGTDDVSLEVLGWEPLANGRPDVVPDADAIAVDFEETDGDNHRFTLSLKRLEDVPEYVLTITATDLVGNPQVGSSFCAAPKRSGTFVAIPPEVSGEPTLTISQAVQEAGGLLRARAGALVKVRIPTVHPVDPYASRVTFSGAQLVPTAGLLDTWEIELDGSELDGKKSLSAVLVDAAGNETAVVRPDIAFVADFTPPQILAATLQRSPFFGPADPGDGAVAMTDTDPRTGETVRAALTLTTNEDVVWAGPLVVTGPGSLPWGSPNLSGRRVDYLLPGVAGRPEGTYALAVALEDRVGNRSSATGLDVALVVDRTGPAYGPDVDTPDRIVLSRSPWGDRSEGNAPHASLAGASGAVEPGATVLVLAGAGSVLSSVEADANGAFGPLAVPAGLETLDLVQLDDAGNLSPTSTVRDVVWTASLRGKRRGDTSSNPHLFEVAPDLTTYADPVEADEPTSVELFKLGGTGIATVGSGSWRPVSDPGSRPALRTSHAVAFDPVRGEIVLTGGHDELDLEAGGSTADIDTYKDLWIWDGEGWAEPTLRGASPGPRYAHAGTWDPALQQVIFFGGLATASGDTTVWAWDGDAWTGITPTGDAPGRLAHAAVAFDGLRGNVVLFGGYDADTKVNATSTWLWDGAGWTEIPAVTGDPAGRERGAAAFDPVSGKVLLHGGTGAGVDGRTFAWNGTAWQVVASAAASPAGLSRESMSPEPDGSGVLLVGVKANGTPETWSWDGVSWTKRTAAHPSAWSTGLSVVLVPDTTQDRVLAVGTASYTATTPVRTWAWTGEAWEAVDRTSDGPEPRYAAATATDTERGEIVVAGGSLLAGEPLDEVWTWGPSGWTQVDPLPVGISGARAAFDPLDGQVVLVGGFVRDTILPLDVPNLLTYVGSSAGFVSAGLSPLGLDHHGLAWHPGLRAVMLAGGRSAAGLMTRQYLYDGSWRDNGASTPGGRTGHVLVTDEAANGVVMLGGEGGGSSQLTDTWVHTGTTWSRKTVAAPSPWRADAAAAWDPTRREVVVFGGRLADDTPLGDHWAWNGGQWAEREAGRLPEPRSEAVLAYDPFRDALLLAGGLDGIKGTLVDATWLWRGAAASTPAHLVSIDLAEGLDAASDEVRAITIYAKAGGEGYPLTGTVAGYELVVWDAWTWRTVTSTSASPGSPTTSCWHVRGAAAPAAPASCVDVLDPDLLDRLVPTGSAPLLRLAVRTKAPNGVASGAAPYGRLVTEDVEVTVTVRAAAP